MTLQVEFHITTTSTARYTIPDTVFEAIARSGEVDMDDTDMVVDFIERNLGKYGIPDESTLVRDHVTASGIEDIYIQDQSGDVPERFHKER